MKVSNTRSKSSNNRVFFWSSECRYGVILDQAKTLGWKLVSDEKNEGKVNLFWIDSATIHEHFRNIQPWQTINHFPGMPNIARKSRMGQNLNKMHKMFPKEFGFYPRTWILPAEMTDFRQQFDSQGNSLNNKIYIIKPDAGCQGRGIFLTRTFDTVPMQESVVAQLYIKKPLLLDGYKFDLRLYCLVTSVKPLRVYLFRDGLVRMCTEEYVKPTKSNINNVCMHLTNYAINKHAENFQQPSAATSEESQEGDSKRSLLWFMNWISEEYGETKANWLWKRMGVLCVRTILSILPTLSREYDNHFKSFSNVPMAPPQKTANGSNQSVVIGVDDKIGDKTTEGTDNEDYSRGFVNGPSSDEDDKPLPQFRGSRCFEVLGFDIMLDSSLKPWIIEVNHLPSFGTDSALDKDIKGRLMDQVFTILPVMADDHQAYMAYHKLESEKRLIAQNNTNEKVEKEEKKERDKEKVREKPSTGSLKKISARESEEVPAKVAAEQIPPPVLQQETEITECIFNSDRLQGIKDELMEVYKKFSPEKISKIDKLLAKYLGHEEEFLSFVYQKYGIEPPPPPEPPVESVQDKASRAEKEAEEKEVDEQSPKPPPRAKTRFSRSLSPPRASTPQRKQGAAWKSLGPDEQVFRSEIMAGHTPDANDEWVCLESSRLTQFTRIFPLPINTVDKLLDNEEAEDEDEEREAKAEADSFAVSPPTNKAASHEEILYQAFVHDRRQIMRLRCPLPSRVIDKNADAALPPLEQRSSRSSDNNSVASTSGHRQIGWKAPPKPTRKEPLKQPTQSQSDAANRLSQGMSAAHTHQKEYSIRQRKSYLLNNAVNTLSTPYGVVLDPNELGAVQMMDGVALDMADLQVAGQPNSKLMEEQARLRNIQMEVTRQSNAAAVLKQQVFNFDPRFYSYFRGNPDQFNLEIETIMTNGREEGKGFPEELHVAGQMPGKMNGHRQGPHGSMSSSPVV